MLFPILGKFSLIFKLKKSPILTPKLGIEILVRNLINQVCVKQGCGNTMPYLSHLVPFHSGQVENFHLLVLGQANTILYFLF